MRRVACAVLLFAFLVGPVGGQAGTPARPMPPAPERIARALQERGVIPRDASPEDVEAAVQSYLQAKLGRKPVDRPNPLARENLARREAEPGGASPHGKKLGHKETVPSSTPVPYPPDPQVAKVLVLLVEFTDPPHNELPQPAPDNNTDFWIPDFAPGHYRQILFDTTEGSRSMANYYLEQSYGVFTTDGDVHGWFSLPVPEAEYGADDPAGGIDNLNGPVWRAVRDLVQAVGSAVPWSDYDVEDPFDLDGDGVADEPDGYVDHLMVVHAGAGQEAGGGQQGDDAIWSHSWWVNFRPGVGPGYGGVETPDGTWVGPYTIMPEDGTIGVFCHEFAHDIGLPDEYDTIYSGESSTGFYTLMSSGSWLGQPLGTEPAHVSVWGKYALGWVDPVRLDPGSLALGRVDLLLDRIEWMGQYNQAVRFDLPLKRVTVKINDGAYSGAYQWYSGKGDMLQHTLARFVDLRGVTAATLEFMAWYAIEEHWDYGYVEVSLDGIEWQTLPGTITTNENPNGNNEGNGITGTSAGWVPAAFDLTPFAGCEIMLRFRYATDAAVCLTGWCLDDIAIDAAGFFDDVESGNLDWQVNGWSIRGGSYSTNYGHYYLMEWRTYHGFSQSLGYSYNFYGDPDTVEFFAYNPGLLLWYRDTQYTDNWVGVHPGHGFLLIVDSHPAPLMMPRLGVAWRTRIQIMDATFSLEPTIQNILTGYGMSRTYPSLSPEPEFNDARLYWSPAKPDSSVITPTYGLNIRVAGIAEDWSAVLLSLYPDASSTNK